MSSTDTKQVPVPDVKADKEAETKLYAELDPILIGARKRVFARLEGLNVYAIKFEVPEAKPVLEKFGLSELVVLFNCSSVRHTVVFLYDGIEIKAEQHWVPGGKQLPYMTTLRAAITQSTSNPDICELETAYWESEKALTREQPQGKLVAKDFTSTKMEAVVKLNRFFGKMPSNEVEKRKRWSDGNGLKVTVEAGPNGWTIIFADAGTQYKDVAVGTDANYAEATATLLKIFPKAKPLTHRK